MPNDISEAIKKKHTFFLVAMPLREVLDPAKK
jgi:hypothetical protein